VGDLVKRLGKKVVSFVKGEYCTELCFDYSSRGCCYGGAYDWNGITEPIKIGDLCIHPEHCKDKCFITTIGDLCAALTPESGVDKK